MSDTDIPQKLGRYEIIREIGKGAMGIVFEGSDPTIGRRVAIKTARREHLEARNPNSQVMQRFLREARTAGTLNHPNIITIYDVGEEGPLAYIAMEFIDGPDLHHLIAEKKRFDVEQIIHMGIQMCDALGCAHLHGVYHRDIKPSNIMVSGHGMVKLMDFGIAHTHDSNLTMEGSIIGTPYYMSPEQFMGQKVDQRSDLFSLGVVLYELLTGEKPFVGEGFGVIMHHVLKSTPPLPGELNYAIPDSLNSVIMKAISKAPQDRYQNAGAFRTALAACSSTQPPQHHASGDMTVQDVNVCRGSFTGTVAPMSLNDAPLTGAIFPTQAPPSALGEETPSKAPLPQPDHPGQPKANLRQARLLTLTAVSIISLLAAFLIGATVYLHSPGSETPETTGEIGRISTAPNAEAVIAPEDARISISVRVYATSDMTIHEDYSKQALGRDWMELGDWIEDHLKEGAISPLHGFQIRATDIGNGKVMDERPLNPDGQAFLEIPGTASSVRFNILNGSEEVYSMDSTDWKHAQYLLIYQHKP